MNSKSRTRPAIDPIKTVPGPCFDSIGRALAVAGGTSPHPDAPLIGYGRPIPLHPDFQREHIRLYEHASLNKLEARSATSPRAGLSSPVRFSADSLADLRPLSATSVDAVRRQGPAEEGLIPDAFVAPLDLHALAKPLQTSISSSSSLSGFHTIRALVHSGDRAHLLTRHFNLETLRATLPDGKAPRSPAVDRNVSMQFIECPESVLPPASPLKLQYDTHAGQPSESRSGRRYLPVDRRFARAHLPALASLMLNAGVQFAEQIELPMPHPDAWLNTLLYIYTSDGSFLTGLVEQNILYLGGKIE
ncbi:hypothetical protein S7711_00985 [Stachybotrys chartarum IBT 7711]|uniref:Uncharacterized protein n=1 Tax=Stachybotrys chartarum (strain CBS 109288 / IBT 7711) TaxID=1280523 RepID=A0A084B0T2_STACB|nr:hypothetical protein S7711_00985 [Stachybotrys chartarum IBT 7711]KFA79160.1 hypothetical protein S40288_09452 [Stachybotrys chartarum IBT 40288]